MRPLVILLCLALPILASSQSTFQPGFVVKPNGDTLKGFIESGNEKKLFSVVPFKANLQAKEDKFTTAEITTFGFTNGNTFKKISYTPPGLADTVTFAKNLLSGYYSLYFFTKGETPYFLLKTRQDSSFLLYDVSYSPYATTVQEGNYKNLMAFLARDCNNLKNNVDRLLLTERDMIKFVADLNTCTDPSSKTVVNYVKPKTQFRVYAYAGGIVVAEGSYEYTGRVVGRFSLPAIDKNTFINVGFNYSYHQEKHYYKTLYLSDKPKTDQFTHIGIPITIQYNFLSGIIRPYVNAGLYLVYEKQNEINDFYNILVKPTSFTPTYILGAGVECPLTSNFMIKADYSYDLFSHYPTVGIAYFFK